MDSFVPRFIKGLSLTLSLSLGANFYFSGKMSSLDLASESRTTLEAPFTLPEAAPKKELHPQSPLLEYLLSKIKSLNNSKNTILSNKGAVSPSCNNCQSEQVNLRYMQCNEQNSYLEDQIARLETNKGILGKILRQPIHSNSIIKPACVQMGMNMRFGASSKSFRQCSSNNSLRRSFRPCISEGYFKLVNNSFNLVSTCMKDFVSPGADQKAQALDVQAVYSLINVESGFHVNAMSGTGAGGIGQFTEYAIQDVNATELNKIRGSLESHSNPQCQQMSREILAAKAPIRHQKSLSCDRISLNKGNPITNMIYTYAYLNLSKKRLNTTIFKNSDYKKKFNLSKEDLDKVKRALMVWSHNAGPAGTWTPVKALLNTAYRGRTVTDADLFIKQLEKYMRTFPARANKSAGRRKETSEYFPAIAQTLQDIEKSVGGGSCVN